MILFSFFSFKALQTAECWVNDSFLHIGDDEWTEWSGTNPSLCKDVGVAL